MTTVASTSTEEIRPALDLLGIGRSWCRRRKSNHEHENNGNASETPAEI
jgi:DNA-directed RNA polymerase subunit N (RpoN/RPB10)